jgi:hypothetical protein
MEVAYFEYPVRSKHLRPLVAALALGPGPSSSSNPPMVFCDGDYGRLLSLPAAPRRQDKGREHRASLTQVEIPLSRQDMPRAAQTRARHATLAAG